MILERFYQLQYAQLFIDGGKIIGKVGPDNYPECSWKEAGFVTPHRFGNAAQGLKTMKHAERFPYSLHTMPIKAYRLVKVTLESVE